jgi:hypothetical protein
VYGADALQQLVRGGILEQLADGAGHGEPHQHEVRPDGARGVPRFAPALTSTATPAIEIDPELAPRLH